MDNYKIQSVLIKKKYFTLHEATMWVVEHGYKVKKVDETKKYYRFRQITPSTLRKNGYTDFRTIKLDRSHSSIELIIAYNHHITGQQLAGGALIGGKLSVENIQALLKASYQANAPDDVNGFRLDPELSNADVKTYYNPSTGQAVVSHKGTQGTADWGNNLVFGVGGEKAYKLTPRYQNSERIQKQAEAKYGSKNVSTIGHSQGGLLAQMVGKNSKEIITYNKASSPFGSSATPSNQYDIRTTGDVVSGAQFLNPKNWFGFASGKKGNEITIPSKATGVEAHDLEQFKYLDSNQMIGAGKYNKNDIRPSIKQIQQSKQQQNIGGAIPLRKDHLGRLTLHKGVSMFGVEGMYDSNNNYVRPLMKGEGRNKKIIMCGGAIDDRIPYNRNSQGYAIGVNGRAIPNYEFQKNPQNYRLDKSIKVDHIRLT